MVCGPMREGDVPGSRETSPFRARQNGERRRDQVDYRGPLQDPTKLPAEQAVRPPPNPVPQARPISDVTVPPDLVSVGAEPLINPWGAFGQELPTSVYLDALRALARRSPRLLRQAIEATSYVDLI